MTGLSARVYACCDSRHGPCRVKDLDVTLLSATQPCWPGGGYLGDGDEDDDCQDYQDYPVDREDDEAVIMQISLLDDFTFSPEGEDDVHSAKSDASIQRTETDPAPSGSSTQSNTGSPAVYSPKSQTDSPSCASTQKAFKFSPLQWRDAAPPCSVKSRFSTDYNCSFGGECGNALYQSRCLAIARIVRMGMRWLIATSLISAGEAIGEFLGHLDVFGPPWKNGPVNDGYRMHHRTRTTGRWYRRSRGWWHASLHESRVQCVLRVSRSPDRATTHRRSYHGSRRVPGEEITFSYGDKLCKEPEYLSEEELRVAIEKKGGDLTSHDGRDSGVDDRLLLSDIGGANEADLSKARTGSEATDVRGGDTDSLNENDVDYAFDSDNISQYAQRTPTDSQQPGVNHLVLGAVSTQSGPVLPQTPDASDSTQLSGGGGGDIEGPLHPRGAATTVNNGGTIPLTEVDRTTPPTQNIICWATPKPTTPAITKRDHANHDQVRRDEAAAAEASRRHERGEARLLCEDVQRQEAPVLAENRRQFEARMEQDRAEACQCHVH
ncbi:hypothetical protein ON010_g1583 [Phytophthora cinnamomi]|nr:hypothetical protein ON010_g1583 [Phytophthora cinnamomi]